MHGKSIMITGGDMTIGHYDRMAPHKTYTLTREHGEGRSGYILRYFREVLGFDNVKIVLVRGNRRRVIASRGCLK